MSIAFTVEHPGPPQIKAVLDTARLITGRLRAEPSTGAVLPGVA
ncbi:hypothetical protein [Streptomyces aquilus]|nr:hypothetical protein [Streptomyces aquilus]